MARGLVPGAPTGMSVWAGCGADTDERRGGQS